MRPSAVLSTLAGCLQGRPAPHDAWVAVLDLANHGLITPHLAMALDGQEDLPVEIADFLQAVLAANVRRNEALRDQTIEAARALNAAGITPTLLKGAGALFDEAPRRREARMLCDLDLMVDPAQTGAAIEALRRAGYIVVAERMEAEVHAVADLAKPGTLAAIDLHQRPPGPPGMARLGERPELCDVIEADGALMRLPCGALQVYLTMLHDQLHDGDYWSGRQNLRHLLDIADLAAAGTVDWDVLESLPPTSLTRNALHTQLVDAHWLTGAAIPRQVLRRAWPGLQHRRRRLQVAHPWLAAPGALLTALAETANLSAHRRADRAGRLKLFGVGGETKRGGAGERLTRLRDIFALPEAGKV
jgi:hypothetical protein